MSRPTPIPLSGEYGLLTVLGRAPTPLGQTKAFWKLRCRCGAVVIKTGQSVIRGELLGCRPCWAAHNAASRPERPKPQKKRVYADAHWKRDTHPLREVVRAWRAM